MANLPQLNEDEYYYISHEGLTKLAKHIDNNDSAKNTLWTSDYTLELPIRMKKTGAGSIIPKTLTEMFQNIVKKCPQSPALSVKRNNAWQTINFKQYYDECCTFAKACISLNLTPYRSVNILGFNSPEWLITFYGSIFGFYLPVGIYTTNNADACQYVSQHSDAELIVVENREQLAKYLKIWDSLPLLKAVVVYNDDQLPTELVPIQYRNKVIQWKDFMEMGRKYVSEKQENSLENRMSRQRPGNMCTLVYTSGTTGQPKGVMLSHDNYTWSAEVIIGQFELVASERIISYLPLSHVAAQVIDIIGALYSGVHLFFATPDALSGALIETLKEIRPNFFFSVPRVWEKIDEKMKLIATQNGTMKTLISKWAKGLGRQGTFAESHNQSPPLCFGLAKNLVYNNVKKSLGLDQARYLLFGAAPLSNDIRDYFLSLNLMLINGYGMSETSGAFTLSDASKFDKFNTQFLSSCGNCFPGTELKIHNPDADGNGEICFRGRNVFKGYYKNEQATRDTLDAQGYLHSGDVGKIDKNGNLTITGRIKELLITAGGENVAPVLIECEIKKYLPFLSNAMVVGDGRKFLAVLITLKYDLDKEGKLTEKLSQEVLNSLNSIGSKSTTYDECTKDEVLRQHIDEQIKLANQNSISNAQHIKKWIFIRGDFTVDGGELTPTLKLKRNVATEKNQASIEQMYQEAKL